MKDKKAYDCVEMKNQIQAELLKRWEGLSDKEVEAQIRLDLNASKSTTAELWRSLRNRTATSGAKRVYA